MCLFFKADFLITRCQPQMMIASNVQHVNEIATMSADFGNALSKVTIMSKIICSLSPSYNNVIIAWSNVHHDEQTISTLEDQVTRYEELMKQ